jgi:hypothetical protein
MYLEMSQQPRAPQVTRDKTYQDKISGFLEKRDCKFQAYWFEAEAQRREPCHSDVKANESAVRP